MRWSLREAWLLKSLGNVLTYSDTGADGIGPVATPKNVAERVASTPPCLSSKHLRGLGEWYPETPFGSAIADRVSASIHDNVQGDGGGVKTVHLSAPSRNTQYLCSLPTLVHQNGSVLRLGLPLRQELPIIRAASFTASSAS